MAKLASGARKTKTANRQQNKRTNLLQHYNAVPFFGALVGVLVSVPLSAALLSSMVKADVASATNGLASRSVHMLPASSTLSCVAPAGGAAAAAPGKSSNGSSKVAGVSKSNSSSSPSISHTTKFINKLVGGVFAKNTASVSNNAPNGVAIAVNKNEITNTNNNEENNTATQSVATGGATVSGNNGAVGSVSTGDASAANKASFVENANN